MADSYFNVVPTFFYCGDTKTGYWINLNSICLAKKDGDQLTIKMTDQSTLTIDGEEAFQLKTALHWSSLNDCLPVESDFKVYDDDMPLLEEIEALEKEKAETLRLFDVLNSDEDDESEF